MGRRQGVLLVIPVVVGLLIHLLSGHSQPSPVLRSTSIGSGSFLALLNAGSHRLYIHTFGDNVLHILDTRTGLAMHPEDPVARSTGPMAIDDHFGQAFIGPDPDNTIEILDARTFAILHSVPIYRVTGPDPLFDEQTDRLYLDDPNSPILSIVDAASGMLRQVPACITPQALMALSHATQHLFESCTDGTTEMFDAHSGRLLRTLNTSSLGTCTCGILDDEMTGRIFLPAADALGVLDARSGNLLRRVPVQSWNLGTINLDGHTGTIGTIDLDPHTGNVVMAPYADPGLGHSASHVFVLDGRTGAILHRWPVPRTPTAVMVNPVTHHLLVTSAGPTDVFGVPLGAGSLSVLDPSSGASLQQIEMGILPASMFFDLRSGHLFVVNFTSDMQQGALTRTYPDSWWSQQLRHVKGVAAWLPFKAPAPPTPPTDVTVITLDLSRL